MAPIPQPHDHLIALSVPLSQLEDGRISEKALIETVGHRRQSVSPARKASKMPGTRALFVALLVGCLVVVGLAHTDSDATNTCSNGHNDDCIDTTTGHDKSALSRWIDSTSPEALHRFLHTVTGFQHGVFDSDQAAVKAVLEIDPALSSTVAQLQRRQGNSTTTEDPTGSANTQTSSVPDESTTTTAITTDPVSTSVESPTTTTTDTTTDAGTTTSDTAVVSPTTTTITTDPAPTSTTTTADTTTTTTNNNAPSNTVPTSTTDLASTTATSKGTTATAKPTSKTSTHTYTLAGGAVTTVTSITVITPGASGSATSAATGDPSLQTGAAVPVGGNRKPLVEVLVGGAVAAAMLV